jgi:hypothetical protein
MTVTLSLSKGYAEGTHALCPFYYALLNNFAFIMAQFRRSNKWNLHLNGLHGK